MTNKQPSKSMWPETAHQLGQVRLLAIAALLAACLLPGSLFSQTEPSALFEVQSTDKGFLLPRMTQAQRDAIVNPAKGLQIYNTTSDCVDVNFGTPATPQWQGLSCRQRSPCWAKVSATDTLVFMCHNLASANFLADPFTPSWEINGAYWQWGRRWSAAPGPVGPGVALTNAEAISGWNTINAPNGSWMDGTKTANDPCPPGYRVPTLSQWEAVLANNTQSLVGNWDSSPFNYSAGRFFGPALMLPAAGYRSNTSGELFYRGFYGSYWSSTENSTEIAWCVIISGGYAEPNFNVRRSGLSVRCASE
jgi:hypothetical protein